MTTSVPNLSMTEQAFSDAVLKSGADTVTVQGASINARKFSTNELVAIGGTIILAAIIWKKL